MLRPRKHKINYYILLVNNRDAILNDNLFIFRFQKFPHIFKTCVLIVILFHYVLIYYKKEF